jgi:hypothetical protein
VRHLNWCPSPAGAEDEVARPRPGFGPDGAFGRGRPVAIRLRGSPARHLEPGTLPQPVRSVEAHVGDGFTLRSVARAGARHIEQRARSSERQPPALARVDDLPPTNVVRGESQLLASNGPIFGRHVTRARDRVADKIEVNSFQSITAPDT